MLRCAERSRSEHSRSIEGQHLIPLFVSKVYGGLKLFDVVSFKQKNDSRLSPTAANLKLQIELRKFTVHKQDEQTVLNSDDCGLRYNHPNRN